MKKLLIAIFAAGLVSVIFAQSTITIGTMTSLRASFPLNDYSTYSRSQCIYLESEIGSPGTIHELRWFRYDTGANPNAIETTQIWLKTVANYMPVGTDWEDPGTLVATISNINLGSGNAWYPVDITDFNYTGGHLMVSVRTQNAPYTSPNALWTYYPTSYPSCRMGASTTVNPPTMAYSYDRPNLQLYMTTSTPALTPWPVGYTSPANGSWAMTGDKLKWNQVVGFPTSYDVYFGTSASPPYVANQTGLSYTPVLGANTTYYWKVVPRNAVGTAAGCPVWSFKTPTMNQLAESFETTPFPPADWANGTTGSFTRSTSYAYHGFYSAYKATSTSTAFWLSTPKVQILATDVLDFWSRSYGANQVLQIIYSADRVTWTQLGANITHTEASTWCHNSINLSTLAGNNYYLGFRTPAQTEAGSMYIDSVIGPLIYIDAPDPVSLVTPVNAATELVELPTFTWTAATTGSGASGYRIYCDTNPDPTTLIGTVAGLSYTATTALNNNTLYYWKVVAYNYFGSSTGNAVRSFTTRPVLPLPYSQDFNSGTSMAAINWTGSMSISAIHGASGTNGLCAHIYGSLPSATAVSYPVGPLPAASELVFDYRIVNWSGYPNVAALILPDDNIQVQISTNGGSSYSTIYTIGYDNHVASTAFATKTVSLNAYASNSVLIKFVCTWGGGAMDYYVDIDNFVIHATTALPDISTFPWTETFEGSTFPPANWSVSDLDGAGPFWQSSTAFNHTVSGAKSAQHGYGYNNPVSGQNGWLVTPSILLPAGSNAALSFWNYNAYPGYYKYNGLKVNTVNNPSDPNWVELWHPVSVAAVWSNVTIDISAYSGQTVYFAFNYTGNDGDDWFLDDVNINVQNNALQAPAPIVVLSAGHPRISWSAVNGANSYKVYGCANAYSANPWTLLTTTANTSYNYSGTEAFMFFKVTSSTAVATKSQQNPILPE